MRKLLLLLSLAISLLSCREDVDSTALQVYEGPMNIATNIHVVHSDSAIVRSEITAAKQLEYLNGNMEFPDGILIEFFERDGTLETTLRADRGYFDKEKNLYRGEGNVQVDNSIEDQHLQSEELYWDPNKKKIFTDKFVTIRDKQTLFNGTGMEADESFTNYTLKNVRDSRTILPGEEI
ncbi:MAG TPA: LPS export ABC transporter periplasmic protein LptC [Algoriphagus sp.]|jgi:LPS export ABC transporter protein LptC|uniref:LPS export ABC transporter periplasmic protein LptC n=1 Tax=unclassified Algoriphagus TaxID=2641541 RepID=UPI000C43AFBE|nr:MULTISPECIES: LPS export ABC transporter periplasmic protein LptC [unclassified Algoriphagus]MAL15429.1 LPS export ABC transporter periplasmic protein LptC [Algoriphagus sp.]QYH40375.1 LPS export ABC transporter periplasmic protein LptC [Algoriphagus sp. NBT04N3]HAD51070.1 LPS export ABC transporter periplasmic protein LptC [Algoriphagus sp.]HAH35497.1 LPS export ABC transporter periplasmic protein LptC [Algoriphagus sp.]HAS59571.1 LPS export ABC transporter periplasmic protein LptC [Algori|tara:strand:+ start:19045 stop:19581 length:537 start_codon:yes stop_codon:yes gene_type:complete